MSTMVEQRSQPLGGYDYDHARTLNGPQFTNPWASQASGMYAQQHAQANDPYQGRAQFQVPVAPHSSLHSVVDPVSRSFAHESHYATATSAAAAPSYAPTSAADRFPSDHYSGSYNTAAQHQHHHSAGAAAAAPYEARYPNAAAAASFSQPSARAFRPAVGRASFGDAVDAGQNMVVMSQGDYTTPRGPYPPRNGSNDSYGFPAPADHSHQGSISSASSYPYYGSYGGSVDGSVAGSSATDYSSASEDAGQRALPPPSQLLNGYPADATQMMTQFNSKLAASAQKKHKCKICDKRFTRPSSLQTHMYSHTGEKPFACDFEGCGRHFSVVSNLRRHKKCHKEEGSMDSGSPEE